MRVLALVIACLTCVVCLACEDPSVPSPSGIPSSPNVAAVSISPTQDDTGKIGRSVRLAVKLGHAFAADAPSHVFVVAGGANAAEVAAIAHNRALADLRAREVPLFAWGDPPDAPMTLFVQPSVPLDAGRATLVFAVSRQPPFTFDLDVRDDAPPAARVWPVGDAKSGPNEPWTWCADDLPSDVPPTIDLAPIAVSARVVRREDAPCIDVTASQPIATPTIVAPPNVGAIAIDPSPITLGTSSAPPAPDAICRAGELAIGPCCARIDDDRIVLVGAPNPTLLLGTIGDHPIFAAIPASDRFVVRGLEPAATIDLSLVVRDGAVETPHAARVTLAAPHPHVVVNEVLGRPPSGASTQRFVELVNDGGREANLGGMTLVVGATSIDLPARSLPAGGFALVVPEGFVDGFGGDAAPASNAMRIVVDALPASGAVSLVDASGRVLSSFPGSTTTRTASRGRRLPWTPDDAPSAFGFDANDRATPGAPNFIE